MIRRTPRTDEMAYAYSVEHKTLEEVGAAHGVTRERVRQILTQAYDIDCRAVARKRTELRRAARGLTPDTPEKQAERFWNRRLSIQHSGNLKKTRSYTDEELCDLLREAAARYGRTPSTRIWIRDKLEPTPPVFNARFGSWKAACLAAGLTPNEPRRAAYTRQWTEDEIIDYLVMFLLDPTDPHSRGGIQEYDRWRKQYAPAAPSGALIRLHLGSWNAAKEIALNRIIEQEE